MELSERLAKAFEIAGKTRRELHEESGVSHSTLSQWLSGHIKALKADTATRVERATGVRAAWLIHGTGPMLVSESSQAALPFLGLKQVPLLNEDQLANQAKRPAHAGTHQNWVYGSSALSGQAFGYRVQGDSMTPLLLQGDLLLFEPDAAACPGSVVAAIVDGAFVLRQYRCRSLGSQPAVFELTAVNELHASAKSDKASITLLGVAVELRRALPFAS